MQQREQYDKASIAACLIGNALEWYDFVLYALFASLIAKLFFPDDRPEIALLSSFAIFAVGYFTRPLGGLLLGHIGDKFSRKQALVITILCMGIATMLIGLLPSYQYWGITSAIILLVLRMIQGLGIGGEYPGSMVILIETAPAKREAFTGSLSFLGAIFGNVLATTISFVVSHSLSKQAFQTWGWRLPFLFGFVLALIGVYIRLRLWKRQTHFTDTHQQAPIVLLLKNYRMCLIKALALWSFTGIYTGIMMIFLFTYLTSYLHFPTNLGYLFQIPLIIITCITCLLSARIVDHTQKPRQWMTFWFFIMLLASYPLLLLAKQGTLWTVIGFYLLTIIGSLAQGPIILMITRMFPKDVRYTGTGLSMGLALSLFAGTAPIILILLINYLGLAAPALYLMLGALLAIWGLKPIKSPHN